MIMSVLEHLYQIYLGQEVFSQQHSSTLSPKRLYLLVWRIKMEGKIITILRFADDVDALAEEERKLKALVENYYKMHTV